LRPERASRAPRARAQPGEWVVVVGAGGVGLSVVMIARALGAHVVAVDRNQAALDAASALGADAVVVADGVDVPDAVRRITGGGAHVSIDAVGAEQTAADAVLSLRRRGRHVQVGLLPSETGLSAMPMARVIAWELDVLGSHGMAAVDYPAMLELIAEGACVRRNSSSARSRSPRPRRCCPPSTVPRLPV
jgi:alcohol dehydrogenase